MFDLNFDGVKCCYGVYCCEFMCYCLLRLFCICVECGLKFDRVDFVYDVVYFVRYRRVSYF